MPSPLNRREFLGATTSAAALLAAGLHARGSEQAAERAPVRIALMGLHIRGKQLLPAFLANPEVEIAYLCEPDDDEVPAALKIVEEKRSSPPKVERDFRKALDDKSVTAVVCAAPDHWHALATILACQAGKDVYVEKPCSHNPIEGRRMVEAARRYGRVVQVGTQRRSATDSAALLKEVQSGKLGDVNFIRCWINSVRPNIGKEMVTAPPANLDFNLWAGPGPGNDYKKNLVHYHWHWRWDYGTGECGNNGIHALDTARWLLGVDCPTMVTCGGGKYFFDDDQQTPDTQLATFDFPNGCIQWEHRTWSSRGIDGQDFGVEVYGSEATLQSTKRGWNVVTGSGDKEKVIEKFEFGDPLRAHVRNFLDCTVSREKPNADIEIGHKSTLLCHLANIAWRTRSVVKFDGTQEAIVDNPAAAALMGRTYRKGFELPTIG